VSVEWLIGRALLIALDRHDLHALAEDRRQLSIRELFDIVSVIDRRVDDLHGLALEAVGDLLEGPALLVLERALDELLGEAVDLFALVLVLRVDAIQRVGEDLLTRPSTRIARDALLLNPLTILERKNISRSGLCMQSECARSRRELQIHPAGKLCVEDEALYQANFCRSTLRRLAAESVARLYRERTRCWSSGLR
jgi:hypothetical protein